MSIEQETVGLNSYWRTVRDEKLAETDTWGLADYPATAEQLAYRQALRDIPFAEGWPFTFTWPTKPS
jgi:hypothetical protein